jgi:16S rRNA (guanine527-N7)-methyltransferase|tara:strand:- start:294 stop:902 length:609 start_codon:yes stop_codon:yes gene_type:complete
LNKEEIIKKFLIKKKHKNFIDRYLCLLEEHNKNINLVGKSTLVNPWLSHVLDSLQVLPFIGDKNQSILDMGTGAGLPGVILKICGCRRVTLIDSNGKKINFLKTINSEMNLGLRPILGRLENIHDLRFDIITSRALASLDSLFTYSQKFIKKNTVLIFLKGKTVNEEIDLARKNWLFDLARHQSISDQRGSLIIVKNLKKND